MNYGRETDSERRDPETGYAASVGVCKGLAPRPRPRWRVKTRMPSLASAAPYRQTFTGIKRMLFTGIPWIPYRDALRVLRGMRLESGVNFWLWGTFGISQARDPSNTSTRPGISGTLI